MFLGMVSFFQQTRYECRYCGRTKTTDDERDGKAWLDAHYDVFHLEGRQELLKEFREGART